MTQLGKSYRNLLLSKEQAEMLNVELQLQGAICPPNKVLIASPVGEIKLGGLYIPEAREKDSLPRIGVVIQTGVFEEGYNSLCDLVEIGRVLTYGLYAGKELEMDISDFKEEGLPEMSFTVLSAQEIVYSQLNTK